VSHGDAPWREAAPRSTIWPTPEQDTLLRAALLPDERALRAWEVVRPTIDIETMEGRVLALLPMLRRNLLALGVDDELFGLFKGVHRYGWARTQMLLAPLLPVLADLHRSSLPTMVLKGAAMLADQRLDGGLRTMNDVDVLVPEDRRREAVETLLSHGMVPVDGAPAWYVVDHAPAFSPGYGFRDAQDRQLDLHWHVLHASCQPGADEEFWAAAADVELRGIPTKALCPADELLLVVLHAMQWSTDPSHRWIVDAALLTSGTFGSVDYDRLVDQATRRRGTAALLAGLSYLQSVAGSPVPVEVMGTLERVRPSRTERLELRALLTQPRRRTRREQWALLHEQYLRHHLAVGRRPTPWGRLRAERRRSSVGPGRPVAGAAAGVGSGTAPRGDVTFALGVPLDFSDPDVVRGTVAYGTWRNEAHGCWLAGRETRIAVPLARRAEHALLASLELERLAGAPEPEILVAANGHRAARIVVDDRQTTGILVPAAALAGRDVLELVFKTRRPVSPAVAGVGDDDRPLGPALRRVTLWAPASVEIGEEVSLGAGTGDAALLLDGWYAPEPGGRWTRGGRAALMLAPGPGAAPRRLELTGDLLRVGEHAPAAVAIRVGGRLAGVMGDGAATIALRDSDRDAAGHLPVELVIREPRSPAELGAGADRRRLGVFLRSLTLV